MSSRRPWRISIGAFTLAACALLPAGCASWQGPRIDPSGQKIFIWPGQTPPPVTPPPPVPGTIVVPAPGTTVLGAAAPATPPPAIVTTPPPPVVTTPPPPPPAIGLPAGNLQAPPVYPDAGIPASPPPVITTPPPPAVTPGAAPVITTPLSAAVAPVPPPPPPVDAQFAFPAPTIAQAGHPLVLTTLVTRRTDRVPLAGWTVRYEVTNTGAALGGSGSSRVEVPTDSSGRASIEISPLSTAPGEAIVNMVAIAPAELTSGGSTIAEVARGTATITWRNGVPGAPAWSPQPLAFGGMAAPSLNGPGLPPPPDTAATTPSQPYTPSDRAPSRFEPPPSLADSDSPKRTYAAPPPQPRDSTPAGKPELAVEVRLRDTRGVEVGGFANFDVIIANRGTAAARNVKVIDRFDAGLSHLRAQAGERAVEYETIAQLAPGESQSVALTFGVKAAGQLCHEVSVSADDAATVVERGCVTAVEPKPVGQPVIEVTKQGPPRHYVGEIAKFRVVVKNTGEVPVTNLEIVDRYDPALDPRFISEGAEQLADGTLQWKVTRLEVGERRTFDVQAACVAASKSACSMATVTADGGIRISEERCVEILPSGAPVTGAPGGTSPPPALPAEPLRVTLQSTANPARVGVRAALYVFVENVSQISQQQVTLRVQMPPEAAPIADQIKPAGEMVGAFEVRFNDIGEIAPGERRQFEIPYSPTAERVVTFSALVQAYGLGRPISVESAPIQIEAAAQ